MNSKLCSKFTQYAYDPFATLTASQNDTSDIFSVQVQHSFSVLIWPLCKTRWHCLFANYHVFAPYSKDIYKYKVLTNQLTSVLNFNFAL